MCSVNYAIVFIENFYLEEMPDLYNLSNAVMDRLDTAVAYLNSNWEYPKTEEACIISKYSWKIMIQRGKAFNEYKTRFRSI